MYGKLLHTNGKLSMHDYGGGTVDRARRHGSCLKDEDSKKNVPGKIDKKNKKRRERTHTRSRAEYRPF